jgi:flagellar hook-associated protein 1 FlgK
MSLLSTMQMAKNALYASQLGIQVTGNNISNADTPGYVREKLELTPAHTQTVRGMTIGTGVETLGVVRQVDEFLLERLRSATSDMGNGQIQEQVYAQLESVVGELSDSDLSTSLTDFFNSLSDVLNQPEDAAIRNLAVLRGQSLANQIQTLSSRVNDMRSVVNDQVKQSVGEVNKLVDEIATLNKQIIRTEKGGYSLSDAVGLRDKRDKALEDLSRLVDIRVDEQKSGAVNVFVGGSYLVFDGTTQLIETKERSDRGLALIDMQLSKSQADFVPASGELAGLMTARDGALNDFLSELDAFAATLIQEFNNIHTSGRGTSGHQALQAEHAVSSTNEPLDAAGLSFTPANGSFQIEIVNSETGVRKTHDVFVRLRGLDDDTSLETLAADLDAIGGLTATIDSDGYLSLGTETAGIEFAFANDTSGVLTSLGLNHFFSGSDASTIGISDILKSDPNKLAVSAGGIGHDTANGERLASMLHSPLESRNGASLSEVYERWVSETAQASALASALSEGFTTFHATLEGQHLGLSGVNMDEEAINLMAYQRTYQAAAKLVATVSELLEILVGL